MAEAWDTARIREAFIYDGGEAEYHDPEHGAQTQRQVAGEIFDRWLAAHDAEVRAQVVAEEPEWEYGYTSKWGTITASSQADAESRAADHARGIAQHRESGDLKYHGKVVKRIAAPKPGEWVPVMQEGADTDA